MTTSSAANQATQAISNVFKDTQPAAAMAVLGLLSYEIF